MFLYGFLNRVLIPTGLHHLVWSPFLYSALGDSMIIGGEQIVGAKPVFLALLSDPSVAMMRDSARFLTYGLMKTFGVIGVAMAFISTAKKEKKPNLFARIGRYFKDVVGELKKLTWPTGKDLAKYTATVLAFIVLFAVVIGVLDFLFGQGFTLLGNLAGKGSDASALADALLGLM